MLVTQAPIQLFSQLQPSLPATAPQPFLVSLHTPLPTQAQDTGLGSLHLSHVGKSPRLLSSILYLFRGKLAICFDEMKIAGGLQ